MTILWTRAVPHPITLHYMGKPIFLNESHIQNQQSELWKLVQPILLEMLEIWFYRARSPNKYDKLLNRLRIVH